MKLEERPGGFALYKEKTEVGCCQLTRTAAGTLSARVWRRHYTERFHLTVLPDWNVLQPVHLHISFSME